MNKEEKISKMITEVEIIEKEAIAEKYINDNAMKKDAVSKIYKTLQEVMKDEN